MIMHYQAFCLILRMINTFGLKILFHLSMLTFFYKKFEKIKEEKRYLLYYVKMRTIKIEW
jgi:hypothetical protein